MIYIIGWVIISVSWLYYANALAHMDAQRAGDLIRGFRNRGADFQEEEGYLDGLDCVTDKATGAIYCRTDVGDWSMHHPERYDFRENSSIRITQAFIENKI